MEACEVVRLFVNKAIVPAEPKRRGNPGYGRVKALRVLVYARLKGLDNDTRLVEHLKKHLWIARTLGFGIVPDRTTVGRWWRRCLSLLEETFVKIADILQFAVPTTIAVVDYTPLVDLYDMEARWGHTRGESSEDLSFMQPLTSLVYHCERWLRRATSMMDRFFPNSLRIWKQTTF
jgi:hypothetical protein